MTILHILKYFVSVQLHKSKKFLRNISAIKDIAKKHMKMNDLNMLMSVE